MRQTATTYLRNHAYWCSLTLLLVLLLTSCKNTPKEIIPSEEFAPYINAYTGGMISQRSTIRIEFTHDQPMVDTTNELKDSPFQFSPSIEGKTYWVNNHTLEFVPEEGALQPGTLYNGIFRLGDFVETDEQRQTFEFSFRVQEQHFALQMAPLKLTATEPDKATVQGEIRFSDYIAQAEVQKIIRVSDGKNSYPVSITPLDDPTRYAIQIEQVPRKEKTYTLSVTADGTPLSITQKEEEKMTIPAKNEFRFLSARRISQPENGVEVVFTSPLSMTQDLKGLIEISEQPSSTYQIRGNKVQLFWENRKQTPFTLRIHEGVKDYRDKKLGTNHSLSFKAEDLKPQVKIGVASAILPDSKNLTIPFKAVNLYAVDLSVIRIFENNILSFLQNNSLETDYELRRSGRMVYKKTLWLAKDATKHIHQWEDYSIDLSGLIRQEPGAIYRVLLSFKQEYSAYPCGEANEPSMQFSDTAPASGLTPLPDNQLSDEEKADWDKPETYYYFNDMPYDWKVYKWEERDNPCHPSYYMSMDRTAACNVFASNLGMTIKRNSQHHLWIAVNDILSTDPVGEAQVTVYNFQLQPIEKGKTDGNGWVELSPKGMPFLVVAEKGKQKAYVRVVDGEELSVSRFDVGGKEIRKGLKGFIYGERGVWRPGDTLHIAFIMEDREKRIPDNHPVALELYNPKGQFYAKIINTKGTNGFYTFNVATQPNAPTGIWNAYVKVGGTSFHKSLRVETIKPNRLKIQLTLPPMLETSQKPVILPLRSSWLTGATASGLKAKVEMRLSKVETQFKSYKKYIFNNPTTEFTSQQTTLFDGRLTEEGTAQVEWKMPEASQAPGMLNASFTTRVSEPGGDASFFTQTVAFSPFQAYVGINLNQPKQACIETDKEHVFDIVTVNAQGELTDRQHLEYQIYKIDWSWWWENDTHSLGTYINKQSTKTIARGKLQTRGGKAVLPFRVNYPSWGRYLVLIKDKDSGHTTGGTVYVDWPEWRGRSKKNDPSGIQMLTFSLDKEQYETGAKATVILPAAAGGRALVSIENGSSVLQQEWIEVSEQEDTRYSFTLTEDMAPNAYVHIRLLQPHAQTLNDLPIRLYGVMPVFVSNRNTVLQPQIQQPQDLQPEKDFTVTVSEKNGRPMTYTLAIVDEGILDLSNFKTPDPWNEFYAREALGISTWDMYDHVLGATAGNFRSLFSTGGDAQLKPADAKANRFKPVVKYFGPFYLSKGKKQTHTVRLPMYIGAVRTMVVAGQDGAYGHAEKSSMVRTPLMLLTTLPRVLSTDEEIHVPVNVFAMERNISDVQVTLQVKGKGIEIQGNRQQRLHFDRPGDQLTFFTVRTGKQTGKATLRITAHGNGQQTHEEIEMDIRNPHPTVTLHSSAWIDGGKEKELSYQVAGAPDKSLLRLEVSRIPSADLSRRLEFLADYQHACTEQLVSKALPLLYVTSFKEVSQEEEKQMKTSVQQAIRQLYSRQLANGGFAYWPGNSLADEWVSSYAGMFLSKAKEKGYAVHENVLNKWKKFQRTTAQNWQFSSHTSPHIQAQEALQQAFRLYTLAVAGAPEYGAMNRMKGQEKLPAMARWRLAAAYALTGQGKMKAAAELVYGTDRTPLTYDGSNLVYGSTLRDDALVLETMLLMHQKQGAEFIRQTQKVSNQLKKEERFDTQSTAMALMVMAQIAEKASGTLQFDWTWNGKKQPAVRTAKAMFVKEQVPAAATGQVTLQNRGDKGMFVQLITRTQLLKDTLPAINDHLQMEVRYTDLNGKPIQVDRMAQGTDFNVSITLSNPSAHDYEQLALTHVVPSGWEVYNERMIDAATTQPSANPAVSQTYTYRDIRDDRVLTYFNLRRGSRKTFTVRLQATYTGDFILPAIQCEDMYNTQIQARSKAGRTIVYR